MHAQKNRTHGPSLWQRLKKREETIAHWIIGIYFLGTVLSVSSWILSPLHKGRAFTWWELTFSYLNVPLSRSLVSVIVLVLITSALLKRRRVALYGVIAFQVLGIFISIPALAHFVAGENTLKEIFHAYNPVLDFLSVLAGLLAIFFCLCARDAFPAKLGRKNWTGAIIVLIVGLAIIITTAGVLGNIQESHGSGETWANAVQYLFSALGMHLPGYHRIATYAFERQFRLIISICYAICVMLFVLVVLRNSKEEIPRSSTDELELRELLHTYGANDSLSYFATRRDKMVIFSDDRKAAVTYRLIRSVCLASGDPVGAPSSWASAISNFTKYARTYGWNLGAMSVSEEGAKAYATAGLSITYMGDEAILYTNRFSLNNTSLTDVRHTARRLEAEGFEVKLRLHRNLSQEQMQELISEVDSWRHGETERGFSMALNRLGDPADGRCTLVTAHSPKGETVGVLSFVPWGSHGISLDIMRRSPSAPNGIVEFMVAGLMEEAPEFGIKEVSLNFAMFRKTFVEADHFGASPWTRAASSALGFFDRYLQLERLYRFNQKFDPTWQPRYLAAESIFTLPSVGIAAGIGEGFLPEWLSRKPAVGECLDPDTLHKALEIERRLAVPVVVEHRYSDQTKHRIRHLEQLRAAGMNPYPLGVPAQLTPVQLAKKIIAFESADTFGSTSEQVLSVAGRARSIRSFGSVVFVELIDGATTVQVVCERERFAINGADLDLLRHNADTGDILIFKGILGRSKNGTASLLATSWFMGAKSLHAIPFENFTDPEARLRRRSTDLIVNPKQREFLRMRTSIITSIRATLDSADFTEVETPILNSIHGGASARPFKTFINAYGAELYLRIAPELYLKRLVVGDMGAVYELGRDFRNEGADATHNPEFTVLEAYKPFADYNVMREVTESLIKNAARSVFGSESLPLGEKGSEKRLLTDISGPWPVKTVCGALSEALGMEVSLDTDFEVLLDLAHQHEIYVRDDMGAGAIIEELYGELVEASTIFPTFYTDFPVETSPLAGPHRSVPGLAERWDLVINGMELGTAYSEMADALEQRRRLTEQSLKAAAGDPEAMEIDEDFLYALETGLPPTGGLGIGVDRLVMLMTGTQIRGVLTFPFVKPASH
ncbi:bifunctional lysylphosphatidylglycerol synthetase/lysine--tRNA ligase LysX [uncultured Rothia sp.]|uniref:bifunctional lysylphosphatidylglycerol synthetase/lysine--tRNA ligase LysX n=1 Tax=uncultured Rothia sp. TaxID=316088 RepID=UPI003217CC9F